jgi:hypothetical protein
MQVKVEAISTFLVVYDLLVEEISLAKSINPASFLFCGVGRGGSWLFNSHMKSLYILKDNNKATIENM